MSTSDDENRVIPLVTHQATLAGRYALHQATLAELYRITEENARLRAQLEAAREAVQMGSMSVLTAALSNEGGGDG
jgi:hypothetical protein